MSLTTPVGMESVGTQSSGEFKVAVATKCMTMSPVSYLSSTRTTVSDIMCTVNRAFPLDGGDVKALRPLFKTNSPYQKKHRKPVAGGQPIVYIGMGVEALNINNDKTKKKANDLKRDKTAYFENRSAENAAKICSAVLLQAAFRGFWRRKAMGRIKEPYIPKFKEKFNPSQANIRNELRRLFNKLSLKPLKGLNPLLF